MRNIFSFLFVFLMLFIGTNCGKDNNPDISGSDSIPLDYRNSGSDTVVLPGPASVFYQFLTVTFYSGPHPHEFTNSYIVSSNSNVLEISEGNGYFHSTLDNDSIIDSNIYWGNRVPVNLQLDLTNSVFVSHNFIGIKLISGEKVRYGWIKCLSPTQPGQYPFLEYAIDTSASNTGVVRAGRKYKSI
jgi:hypothetical protein